MPKNRMIEVNVGGERHLLTAKQISVMQSQALWEGCEASQRIEGESVAGVVRPDFEALAEEQFSD